MIWIHENYFYNQFYHIWFKSVKLTLKIMDFENVSLTKVVHVYVAEAWMHNIHDIKSIFSQNVFMSKM